MKRAFFLFLMLVAGVCVVGGCTTDSYNGLNAAVTPYIYKEQLEGREVFRMTMKRSSVWVDPVGARIVAFGRSNRAQMKAKQEGEDVVFVENKAVPLFDYHRFDGEETMTFTPDAPNLRKSKFWLTYTNIGQMTFTSQSKDGWVLTRDFRMMDNGALYVTSTLQNRELSGREVTVRIGFGAQDTAMILDGKAVGLSVAGGDEVLMRHLVPAPAEEDYMQWNADTPTGVNAIADKEVRFTEEEVARMKIVTGAEARAYDGFVIGPVSVPMTGQHRWTEKWSVIRPGAGK